MPQRSISLTITSSEAIQIAGVDAQRLVLTLGSETNITNRLFVVRAAPTAEDADRSEFITVAAVADLDALQEDAPPGDDSTDLFRTNEVALTTDDPAVVDEFITSVQRRLTQLLTALKVLDENAVSTTFTVTI